MIPAAASGQNDNNENCSSSSNMADDYYESLPSSSQPQTTIIAPQTIVSGLVKSASRLRGLTFGNKIDELLQGGLAPKTFTFVYGPGTEHMMNALCGNAIQIFGGQAVYIDAANSFDPYTIVRECFISQKNSEASDKLLQSITISRAFTCYQLTDLVVKQLSDLIEARNNLKNSNNSAESQIKFVCVSGVSSVFNEQDNSKAETERLQCLMAAALSKIISDRQNGVTFVVAASKEKCNYFISKSDVAIKVYGDKKSGEKAKLVKHYSRQFVEINL